MPIDWEFARIDRLVSICLDLKRMGHAADDDLGSTWFELAARALSCLDGAHLAM